MSTIKVKWTASSELVQKEYVETGEKPKSSREFELDLTTLTPEQRKPVIEYLASRPCMDMSITWRVNTGIYYAKRLNCLDHSGTGDQRHSHQPTTEEVVAHCQAYLVTKAEADVAKAAFDAKEQAEKERIAALETWWGKEVDHWINNRNIPRLRELAIPDECVKLRIKRKEAIRKIAKEMQEADKEYWIGEHGSAHLKRAFSAGYDCQREYVLQRAAKEAPDACTNLEVDFNDTADWKTRSCPTTEALDIADAMRKILGNATVVWLTEPASSDIPDPDREYYEDYCEPFEACEAVISRNYLDKYDLVQIVV